MRMQGKSEGCVRCSSKIQNSQINSEEEGWRGLNWKDHNLKGRKEGPCLVHKKTSRKRLLDCSYSCEDCYVDAVVGVVKKVCVP